MKRGFDKVNRDGEVVEAYRVVRSANVGDGGHASKHILFDRVRRVWQGVEASRIGAVVLVRRHEGRVEVLTDTGASWRVARPMNPASKEDTTR